MRHQNGVWEKTGETAEIDVNGNKEVRTKLKTLRDVRLKPGEKMDVLTLDTSKLLSTNGKLDFGNTAEVPEPKAGIENPNEVLYGRQPEKANGSAERVVITNATGENRDYVLPISIGIGTLAIVGLTIIWTKKKTASSK